VRSAVDSNVLLDVFGPSPQFAAGSGRALRRARADGALVACEVVWAEVRAYFSTSADFEQAMGRLEIAFDSCTEEAANLAGEAWRGYRRHRGSRAVLVPDFLVAAHARLRADRLITRDRGFLRGSFAGLTILDPTEV
jgi:hypothetical protein